jgi:hypothetical protein
MLFILYLTLGVLLCYLFVIHRGEALVAYDCLGALENDFGGWDILFRRSLYLDKKVSF